MNIVNAEINQILANSKAVEKVIEHANVFADGIEKRIEKVAKDGFTYTRMMYKDIYNRRSLFLDMCRPTIDELERAGYMISIDDIGNDSCSHLAIIVSWSGEVQRYVDENGEVVGKHLYHTKTKLEQMSEML